MTNKDPHRIYSMDVELDDMAGTAYDNFIQSIQSKETLRGHTRDIEQFLLVITPKEER